MTATVKAASGTAKPTGTINVMLGSKKVGTGKLKNGTVTITVKGTSLKKGTNKLVVRYVPTASFKAPAKSPERHRPPHQVTPGGGPGSAPAHHRPLQHS